MLTFKHSSILSSTSLFFQHPEMSSVVSLFTDRLRDIQSNLCEAERVLTKTLESLLSSFQKNDELYSNAFVKHIGHDPQLRGKYELMCDLRKSAIDEHASEVRSAINTQSDAIRHCMTQLNDIISSTSVQMKVEPVEDQSVGERDRAEMTINQQSTTLSVPFIGTLGANSSMDTAVSTTSRSPSISSEISNEHQIAPAVVSSNSIYQSGLQYTSKYGSVAPSYSVDSTTTSSVREEYKEDRNVRKRNRLEMSGFADIDYEHPAKRQRIDIEAMNKIEEQQAATRLTEEMRILAEKNRSFNLSEVKLLFETEFNRNLQETYRGKIKRLLFHFPNLFDMKHDRKINQWIATSKVFRPSKVYGDSKPSKVYGPSTVYGLSKVPGISSLRSDHEYNRIKPVGLEVEEPAKPKRIDIEVEEPQIIRMLEEEMRATNQRNKESAVPSNIGNTHRDNERWEANISGVWVYPADNKFKLILREDTITDHVTGIMMLDNETQCLIEGEKKVDIGRATADKSYYRICKIFPGGQRAYYSIDLGPNYDNMTITKDGDTRAKTVVLETREIPSRFEEEIVCNICMYRCQCT